MNIPNGGVLETSNKMLGEECLIISVTRILPYSKEYPLVLIHHHITLLESMELIYIGLIVLCKKKFLSKPLLKDLLGEIGHVDS